MRPAMLSLVTTHTGLRALALCALSWRAISPKEVSLASDIRGA